VLYNSIITVITIRNVVAENYFINTGLLKMIVEVLTTYHTQYT